MRRKPTPAAAETHTGEETRQGVILLRRRWQRTVFIVGLAGAVVLALVLSFRG